MGYPRAECYGCLTPAVASEPTWLPFSVLAQPGLTSTQSCGCQCDNDAGGGAAVSRAGIAEGAAWVSNAADHEQLGGETYARALVLQSHYALGSRGECWLIR